MRADCVDAAFCDAVRVNLVMLLWCCFVKWVKVEMLYGPGQTAAGIQSAKKSLR